MGDLLGGSSQDLDTWLITMVSKPLPLPNGLNGLYMGVILTTYKSWDDPPSTLPRKAAGRICGTLAVKDGASNMEVAELAAEAASKAGELWERNGSVGNKIQRRKTQRLDNFE